MARHQEVRSFTGLRGIAALYVTLFHFFPVLSTSHPLTRVLDHGYLAVDLFFVLSGFVMAMTYGHMFSAPWNAATYRKFLGRRIARIYPLYLFAVVVALILIVLGVRQIPGRGLAVVALSNLFMVQTWGIAASVNLPAWSISAEFAAYLLFPFLLVPTLRSGRASAWFSALAAAAALVLLACLHLAVAHGQHPQRLLDISNQRYCLPVIRCLAEFVLGLLSFRASTSRLGARLAAISHLPAALSVAVLILLAVPFSDVAIVLLFPPLLVTLMPPDTTPARLLASPVPMLLGRLSYSIYLIQGLLVELLSTLHQAANHRGFLHVTRYINTASLLVVVLLAWVVHRTLEVPARGWLRSVFEHRRQHQSQLV